MTHQHLSTAPARSSEKKLPGDSLPADGGELFIDGELCLNLRGRSVSCEACAYQCPFAALELSEDAVSVNSDNCTACGACLSSCPTGVFRLRDFSPAHFLQGLNGAREAHIHCTASAGEDETIDLPCLQLLDAHLLAAAFAAGTEVFHLAGLSHCEQCDKGNAINQMAAVQNQLMQWFGADTAPRMIVASIPLTAWIKDRHRQQEPAQMSRRQFFRLAGSRVAASAGHYTTPAMNNDDAPPNSQTFPRAATQHQRSVDYRSLLAAHANRLPWRDNKIPWHDYTIDNETCSACLACGQRCPTGALTAEQSDAGCGISFKPSLCTDCGLCMRLCPMDAIERSRMTNAAEVMTARTMLMYRQYRNCQHCGQAFLPQTGEATLCHACENEQALESQWLTQCVH